MTASAGAGGSARGDGSAGGAASADASALDRPWAHGPAAAGLSAADHATIEANLRLASGGAAPPLAWHMLRELAAASGAGADGPDPAADGGLPVFAAVEAALALSPRDPLEGMLATQMAAVNAAAMRCLVRAAECTEYPQIEALYLRLAARLLNLFVRQAEALDRRARGPGGAAAQGRGEGPYGAAADGAGSARGAVALEGGAERPDHLRRIAAILGIDIEARQAGTRARGRERAARRTGAGQREPDARDDSGDSRRNPEPAGGPDP